MVLIWYIKNEEIRVPKGSENPEIMNIEVVLKENNAISIWEIRFQNKVCKNDKKTTIVIYNTF